MATSQRKLTRLSELVPGAKPADFFALLTDKTRGVTHAGKPYFSCRFRDARRAVTLMVWGDPDSAWFAECEREWQPGRFYKLRAAFNEHPQYGPQIELERLRPVRDEDRAAGFDEADFVEHSRYDAGAMLTELTTLAVKHIQDEPLRELVRLLLDAHGDDLRRLPAQRERAFPFAGGLLEHTLSVTRTAVDLGDRYAAAYPDLKPALNRDLITAAAILHDLGRVAELDAESHAPGYTVAGRLLGHQVLGRDLVREAAREVPGLNADLLSLLEHILLTSLHPSEGVGPRVALIPEALIVHHADELDLKMEQFARLLARDAGAGPFTARDPALGRALLKGRVV